MLCLASHGTAQQAPPAPDKPWLASSALAAKQRAAVAQDRRTSIDAAHRYTLPELVDLAEQHNPSTRVAWEAAKGRAAGLRIARADLLPALTGAAMANTTREGVLFGSTFVRQTVSLYQAMLEVNYLIFDFGERAGQIEAARQQLLAANYTFNRTQLDVLFETAQRYYRLLNAIGQSKAAQVNLDNAEAVRKAIEARLAVGLATLPDALEARAAAAQANYALQAAIGEVDTARGDLLSLLGASPLDPLDVQPLAELPLPDKFNLDVKAATERGLAQRPELGEEMAEREAARASIRQARSSFLPDLNLQGQGGELRAYGQQDQLAGVYLGPKEEWNVSLDLRWQLFDGGRREGRLTQAHADERRAQAQIDETRDTVEQQVWSAYVSVRTAFYQRTAATELLKASQTSYEAALKSYQLGLRNTVDVVTAQRTLAQALSSDVSARTNLLTGLANFAYRTGDLLNTAPRKAHP